MGKIKTGIIGGGYMAQMAHIPCLAANNNVQLAALCDCRPAVASTLCRDWNIPVSTDSVAELLKMDLDAVYVLTPVQCHLNQIQAALVAGKHVFTEKPAAMSAASVARLIEAQQASGKTVSVGYMKRNDSNLSSLRGIQEASDWGKLLFIRTHSFIGGHWNAAVNEVIPVVSSDDAPSFDASSFDPAPEWLDGDRNEDFYSFNNPYYALLDTGCHSVNLLRYLTDIQTSEITDVKNSGNVSLIDFDFEGTPGTMEFCLNFKMNRWDEVTELYFEKASVTIKTPPPLDRQSSAEVEIYLEEDGSQKTLRLNDNRQWAFRLQTEKFVEKIQSGEISSDLPDSLEDLRTIETIYKLEKEIC